VFDFDTPITIGTLAQWVGAGVTFLAVLVALFKDEFFRWWRKPKLTVSAALAPPECHKTTIFYGPPQDRRRASCYYLRIWVKNNGRTRAESVQVFVSKLRRRNADGSFKEVEAFLPMNLLWAHGQQKAGGPEIFADGISPEMGKHCDLGHVVDPKFRKEIPYDLPGVAADETILALDLEVKAANSGFLVPPGTYQLELRVAAANCAPVTNTIELTITGRWSDDQTQMFSNGLGLKVIG